MARDIALRGMAVGKRIDSSEGWVRFPLYHHLFEHERADFQRQLDFLRNFGDFISIDHAMQLLRSNYPIDGRYFSLGFDDGFKSCALNAPDILMERTIPATFYVVTAFIGSSLPGDDKRARDVFGHEGTSSLDFMSWDDCRRLVSIGMTIGSHTVNHVRLTACTETQTLAELAGSKSEIERQTGAPCLHFCAPYGRSNADFEPNRDIALAHDVGYLSFATGDRGANFPSLGAFCLKRDHLLPQWGLHQLRYFFSV